MANKTTFQGTYNSPTTGLFKTNITKDIGSDDLRALVDSIVANNPFTDDDSYTWASPLVTISGTTTLTGTVSPAIAAYATGQTFKVKSTSTITGAATLNLNTVGAKKVYISPTVQAGSGIFVANGIYILVYDSALDSASGGFLIIGGGSVNGSGAAYVFCGSADLTGDLFPTTGGTGASGAVKMGNSYRVSVAGSPSGNFINVNAEIIALVDTPGQTYSNWWVKLV